MDGTRNHVIFGDMFMATNRTIHTTRNKKIHVGFRNRLVLSDLQSSHCAFKSVQTQSSKSFHAHNPNNHSLTKTPNPTAKRKATHPNRIIQPRTSNHPRPPNPHNKSNNRPIPHKNNPNTQTQNRIIRPIKPPIPTNPTQISI